MTHCEICNCATKRRSTITLNGREFKICSNCNCNLKSSPTKPKKTTTEKTTKTLTKPKTVAKPKTIAKPKTVTKPRKVNKEPTFYTTKLPKFPQVPPLPVFPTPPSHNIVLKKK